MDLSGLWYRPRMRSTTRKLLAAIGAIVLAVVGYNYYFALQKKAHLKFYDDMDRQYHRRQLKSAEKSVRVMVSLRFTNYQGPVDQPSLQFQLRELGQVPVIVSLPGCGFPTWARDVPMYVPILTIERHNQPVIARACVDGDYELVEKLVVEDLDYIMDAIKTYDWVDKNRVLLHGSGESGPIIARYRGKVSGKLVWGDPCSIPWGHIETSMPLTILLSREPQGLRVERHRGPFGVSCQGLERLQFPSSVRVVTAGGAIAALGRPPELLDAQRQIYRALAR